MSTINHVSYKQEYLKGNETKFTQIESTCKLHFSDNRFVIEIPNSQSIEGSYTFQRNEDGQDIYETDAGCMLAIGVDKVFINLFPTHGICWVFFLPNYIEPSFSEKILSDVDATYQFNKKHYGVLVANCALERKIIQGLSITDVITILGASNDAVLKQVNASLEIGVFIYDDYYIILENSIVVYARQIES